MGANIYPQDVEYGLYQANPLAGAIEGFALGLEEGADLESRPVVHVQLRPGTVETEPEREQLAKACRAGVLRHLASCSRDFAQSMAEDASAAEIAVRIHPHGTGPFAGGTGIKNTYLVKEG
jgi:phenylacetate-CoA ligase